MKLLSKTLMLIVFVLSTQNLFSQSLSLVELIRLNNFNNEDAFNEFITAKGFTYMGTNGNINSSEKYYVLYEEGIKTSYLTKCTYHDVIVNREMISYQIPHSEIYLDIKNSLKNQGFIYEKTHTRRNTTFFDYTKNNLTLRLTLTKTKNKDGTEYTAYEITITKIK